MHICIYFYIIVITSVFNCGSFFIFNFSISNTINSDYRLTSFNNPFNCDWYNYYNYHVALIIQGGRRDATFTPQLSSIESAPPLHDGWSLSSDKRRVESRITNHEWQDTAAWQIDHWRMYRSTNVMYALYYILSRVEETADRRREYVCTWDCEIGHATPSRR